MCSHLQHLGHRKIIVTSIFQQSLLYLWEVKNDLTENVTILFSFILPSYFVVRNLLFYPALDSVGLKKWFLVCDSILVYIFSQSSDKLSFITIVSTSAFLLHVFHLYGLVHPVTTSFFFSFIYLSSFILVHCEVCVWGGLPVKVCTFNLTEKIIIWITSLRGVLGLFWFHEKLSKKDEHHDNTGRPVLWVVMHVHTHTAA